MTADSVAERLLDWCKTDGITLLTTSLLDESSTQHSGGAPLQISSLADMWIHLNYVVQSGERKRGLSIVKARGTAHSNQVSELVLRASDVTLADIYTSGGEVLMGTLRWEREGALRVAGEFAAADNVLKRSRLDAEQAEVRFRLQSLRTELKAKQAEASLLSRAMEHRRNETSRSLTDLQKLRGADPIAERCK